MNGTCYSRKVIAKKPKYLYEYQHLKTKKVVSDKKLLEKLNSVKIPATYTNVIVCPDQETNLQATAYDGTGRKQYFYSKKHLEDSRQEKYSNLVFLGLNVDKIVKDIDGLVKRSSVNLDVLNGMALKIMLMCNFRVGSTHNREKYKTYGLSTLTPEHIKFHSGKATIKFNGKKQQLNECTLDDKNTVSMLNKLYLHNKSSKAKQKYLFSWDGARVTPDSLNEFLGRYHVDITTKTWRTWFANIRYISLMKKEKTIPESKNARKKISNEVVKKVAEELHHTAAICKKNYLMTELVDLFVEHPDKWEKEKGKSNDNLFMDFLKNKYHITKDWIRKRSRTRRESRKESRKVSKKRIGGAMGGPSFREDLISERRRKQYKTEGKEFFGGGKKLAKNEIDEKAIIGGFKKRPLAKQLEKKGLIKGKIATMKKKKLSKKDEYSDGSTDDSSSSSDDSSSSSSDDSSSSSEDSSDYYSSSSDEE